MTARPAPGRSLPGQLAVFGAVGVASTVVHLGGFVLLRELLSAQTANGLALLVAAMANTWANRRWTFGVRGRAGAARHQAQGLLVLGLTLAMTSGGLWALGVVAPGAPTWLETTVVGVTTALATAVKFLAMRWWVFRPGPPGRAGRGRAAQNSATTNLPAESSKNTAPVQS